MLAELKRPVPSHSSTFGRRRLGWRNLATSAPDTDDPDADRVAVRVELSEYSRSDFPDGSEATPGLTRSRVMGIVTMCIGTGPVGVMMIGILSAQVGLPAAILVMAGLGLCG